MRMSFAKRNDWSNTGSVPSSVVSSGVGGKDKNGSRTKDNGGNGHVHKWVKLLGANGKGLIKTGLLYCLECKTLWAPRGVLGGTNTVAMSEYLSINTSGTVNWEGVSTSGKAIVVQAGGSGIGSASTVFELKVGGAAVSEHLAVSTSNIQLIGVNSVAISGGNVKIAALAGMLLSAGTDISVLAGSDIRLSGADVSVFANADIALSAAGDISVVAVGDIQVSAAGDISIDAANIRMSATDISIGANANALLSAGADISLKAGDELHASAGSAVISAGPSGLGIMLPSLLFVSAGEFRVSTASAAGIHAGDDVSVLGASDVWIWAGRKLTLSAESALDLDMNAGEISIVASTIGLSAYNTVSITGSNQVIAKGAGLALNGGLVSIGFGNMHVDLVGSISMAAKEIRLSAFGGDILLQAADELRLLAGNDISVLAGFNMRLSGVDVSVYANADLRLLAGNDISAYAAGDIALSAGDDVVLDAVGSLFLTAGGALLAKAATVTIAAGSQIVLSANDVLGLHGTLVSIGQAQSIVFSAADHAQLWVENVLTIQADDINILASGRIVASVEGVLVSATDNVTLHADTLLSIAAGDIRLSASTGDILLQAADDLLLTAAVDISIEAAGGSINILAPTDDKDILLNAGGKVSIAAVSMMHLQSPSVLVSATDDYTLNTADLVSISAGGDIFLGAEGSIAASAVAGDVDIKAAGGEVRLAGANVSISGAGKAVIGGISVIASAGDDVIVGAGGTLVMSGGANVSILTPLNVDINLSAGGNISILAVRNIHLSASTIAGIVANDSIAILAGGGLSVKVGGMNPLMISAYGKLAGGGVLGGFFGGIVIGSLANSGASVYGQSAIGILQDFYGVGSPFDASGFRIVPIAVWVSQTGESTPRGVFPVIPDAGNSIIDFNAYQVVLSADGSQVAIRATADVTIRVVFAGWIVSSP